MNHDDIIRMVREVADPDTTDPLCGGDQRDLVTLNLDEMVRFAALVAAKKDKQIAELLEALEAVLFHAERRIPDASIEVIARAAIAKARGEK